MADITVERSGLVVQKLMQLLEKHPDGMRARDALSQLEASLELTEYERGEFKDGLPRFPRLVRFSTIDLVKAGWMRKQHGYWYLTEAGATALEEHPDATDLFKTAKVLYAQWRRDNRSPTPVPDLTLADEDLEESTAEDTLEAAQADAWDQVYQHISSMDPYDFQDLVAGLLVGMGYHISWTSPPGPDRGLDILAYTDPLGASGPRIKVQVKRRGEKTTADEVRSFMAILGDHDIGLYISTGGFTSNAESEVRDQQTRRLTLLNAERMFDLWIEHYSKIPEARRILLPLRPIYFLDHQVIDD